MKTEQDELEMEVFRSGDYGPKGSYTATDLQQMADDYRPDLLEAPLTFDHAQSGPAYGWVTRLRLDGDRLVALLKGVPDAVREMMRSGAYKRRSIELFQKLPQTGRPYLRAVSLLGAATPEVKGLRDVCFAANAAECAVRFEEQRDASEPAPTDRATAEMRDSLDETLERLKHQLRDAQFAMLFSELRADGYCLGERDAQAIRQLFSQADAAEATVRFDDGTHQPGLDWLSEFLRQGLLLVPKEQQTPDAATPSAQIPAHATQFSERTDPQSFTLHQRALGIQANAPGMAYREALTHASRQR